MFGYFFWWLRKDKPRPAYEDEPTQEIPVSAAMLIGPAARAPEDGWAERMRIKYPPGDHRL
jgi:hypothetical protein